MPSKKAGRPKKDTKSTSLQCTDCVKKVKELIDAHTVVVFGLSYCPWCQKAKELANKRYSGRAIRVDLDLNPKTMPKVKDALQKVIKKQSGITDHKTWPKIFLNGSFVGGYENFKDGAIGILSFTPPK